MGSDAFKAIIEKVGESRRQTYISKLYNPQQKSNLFKFLNTALVHVKPSRFLTDDVIQTVSNEIMTRLYQSHLSGPKYPLEDTTNDAADDNMNTDCGSDDGNDNENAEEDNHDTNFRSEDLDTVSNNENE